MKTLTVLIFCLTSIYSVKAQRCLQREASTLFQNITFPSKASEAYEASKIIHDGNGDYLKIANYGKLYLALDSLATKLNKLFGEQIISNSSANISQGQIQDAQQLAEKMSSMTEEQRKAYAMNIAQQKMSAGYDHSEQESPEVAKTIMQAKTLSQQLESIENEYKSKINQITQSQDEAILKIESVDDNCPGVGKTRTATCSCTMGFEKGKYLKSIDLINKNNGEILNKYQNYAPKIKDYSNRIDQIIGQLHYGDDVKTKNWKSTLLSAQQQMTVSTLEFIMLTDHSVRQYGADKYLQLKNTEISLSKCND